MNKLTERQKQLLIERKGLPTKEYRKVFMESAKQGLYVAKRTLKKLNSKPKL